jgi:CheY-like chemotaxis protein
MPTMRVLVVDDEPTVAEAIADAIRVRGDEALVALDGTEALNILETTKVDGVFLDLAMPGLSGLAVLAKIRARLPSLPVVILSGHIEDDQVREALAMGAVEVIRKPTALARLTEALSRISRS